MSGFEDAQRHHDSREPKDDSQQPCDECADTGMICKRCGEHPGDCKCEFKVKDFCTDDLPRAAFDFTQRFEYCDDCTCFWGEV